MSFQDYRKRHPEGTLVEVDHYPANNPYQCVDLPKDYLIEEFGIANGTYGDSTQWGYYENHIPLKALTEAMERAGLEWLYTSNVQPGDICPLKKNHIGLATGEQDPNQFQLYEQNGSTGNGLGKGKDRIRTRWIPKSRLLGVWRKKAIAQTAVAIPVPAEVVIEITSAQGNVRSSPGMFNNIVPKQGNNPMKVLAGQRYGAVIDSNGWAEISFNGIRCYVGPKVYRKV